MKEVDNIDKLLNQKLSNYSGMEPSDFAFNKIQKRLFWLRFFDISKIAGISLGILIISYFTFIELNKTETIKDSADSKISKKIILNSHLENNFNSKIDNSIFNKNIVNNSKNNRIDKDKNLKIINNQTNEEVTSTIISELNPNKEIISNVIENKTIIENNNIQNKYEQVIIYKDTATEKNDNIIKKYKKEETLTRKIKNKLSVEISMNYFNINKYIINDQTYKDIIKTRNESESAINMFSPELELRYDLKHFFIQSGINLMTYGENTHYLINKKTQQINNILLWKDTMIFSGGNWIYDSVLTTTYDTIDINNSLKYQNENRYKFIEIPILVGHSIVLRKFTLDISSGMSFGFLLQSNAQILDNDKNSLIEINSRNNPIMNKLMLNYLFRFACRYNVRDNLSLFVRASGKLNAVSLFDQNYYPINQKYNALGVGVGINYKF